MSKLQTACIIIILTNCTVYRFSPHAQNEMAMPVIDDRTHEIGAAVGINEWIVNKGPDTTYVNTYPPGSVSLFHTSYWMNGNLGGFGGLELILSRIGSYDPEINMLIEPDEWIFFAKLDVQAAIQYQGDYLSLRLNLRPFSFFAGISDPGPLYGIGVNRFTFYQFTIFLHNRPLSNPQFAGGYRFASGGQGLVGYGEYTFNQRLSLRAEYSYLWRPPFSLWFSSEELEEITGSVHYLTIGIFKRIK